MFWTSKHLSPCIPYHNSKFEITFFFPPLNPLSFGFEIESFHMGRYIQLHPESKDLSKRDFAPSKIIFKSHDLFYSSSSGQLSLTSTRWFEGFLEQQVAICECILSSEFSKVSFFILLVSFPLTGRKDLWLTENTSKLWNIILSLQAT